MSFKNKVVLVTGASSGIGAATATLFARNGANVVLVGRNKEKIKVTTDKCAKTGNEPLPIIADITDEESARNSVSKTIEHFGKIDVLVNNAGILKISSIFDTNVMGVYDSLMKTNIRAVINMTHLTAPHLIKSKGNIINISSYVAKTIVSPYMTYYSVSKAALDQFTRGAAVELGAHGVRVNAISPGPVRTDITDNAGIESPWEQLKSSTVLKRVSNPEEIANLVMFVASEKAKGIIGSDFLADNGSLLFR